MDKYVIVIEKSQNNYSAFSPDAWGCVATGNTVEETVANMKEALHIHFDGIFEDGETIPEPKGISQHIADGVFDKNEIAAEYFITEIRVPIPQFA
jgi:predicted RNase H-like HicB family nuclease